MLYRVAGFSAGLLAAQASAFTLPSTHRAIASATATTIASAPPRHSLLKLVAEPQVTATDAPPGLQCDEDGCVLSEEEEGGVMMNGVSVTADKLRSMELSDVNGNVVPVSSMIGESGSAVIVFLRHLGWPLCWNYALDWQKQSARLSSAGVAGPLFISVGRPDQLQKFLELNPELEGAKALIDESPTFEGYKAAGFNYLMGDKALEKPPDFKPPTEMGVGKWFTYLKNVMALSPVPKDIKFGDPPPAGVKVLGGTYALDGDAVVFSHMDEVPGATPDVEDVLRSVSA